MSTRAYDVILYGASGFTGRQTVAYFAAHVPEGPASIESMYEEYLSIPATARRAVELEQEGWEALILGCYGDPGLDALRELVSIPVVGPGEATALVVEEGDHRDVIPIVDVTRWARTIFLGAAALFTVVGWLYGRK